MSSRRPPFLFVKRHPALQKQPPAVFLSMTLTLYFDYLLLLLAISFYFNVLKALHLVNDVKFSCSACEVRTDLSTSRLLTA